MVSKLDFKGRAMLMRRTKKYYSVLFQRFHDGNSSTAPLWLHIHPTFLLPPKTLYSKGCVALISGKEEASPMSYSRKTNKLALFLVSIFCSCRCSKGLKLSLCARYVVFYNILASCLQWGWIWDKPRQETWILLCRVCICPFIFFEFWIPVEFHELFSAHMSNKTELLNDTE